MDVLVYFQVFKLIGEVADDDNWTILATDSEGDEPEGAEEAEGAELIRQASIEELLLEADIESYLEAEEQKEEDLLDLQMVEENEKALASAIEEEEHWTKELEDEALKNMEEDTEVEDAGSDKEDAGSDKESANADEGQITPRTTVELDESVSYPS